MLPTSQLLVHRKCLPKCLPNCMRACGTGAEADKEEQNVQPPHSCPRRPARSQLSPGRDRKEIIRTMESFNANLQGGKKLVKSLEKQSVRRSPHCMPRSARYDMMGARLVVAARELLASAFDAGRRGPGRRRSRSDCGRQQRVNTAARHHAGEPVRLSVWAWISPIQSPAEATRCGRRRERRAMSRSWCVQFGA